MIQIYTVFEETNYIFQAISCKIQTIKNCAEDFCLCRQEKQRKINWGKGFATELANGSVKYGFEKLMLDQIHAFADAGNKQSKHVLEKAGLHFVEKFDYEGEEHDWFEITRSDWENKKL